MSHSSEARRGVRSVCPWAHGVDRAVALTPSEGRVFLGRYAGAVPHLAQRSERLLRRLEAVGDDASSAEHLGQRVLTLIQEAVPFDEGGLFLLDPETLIFTRLLAHVGESPQAYLAWVRDVYLVEDHGAGMMHFPTLLRSGGGVSAVHERFEHWLRVPPPPMPARAFSSAWRETLSPRGGVLRCGLAYRRRWIGAVQLERGEAGPGFRSSELELLGRAGPGLARSLASFVFGAACEEDPSDTPASGQIVFDDQRRMVAATTSGHAWLERLPGDLSYHRAQPEPAIAPVAVQALVSHLAASGASHARLATVDRTGGPVVVRGEPIIQLPQSGPSDPRVGYCLTIERGGLQLGGVGASITGSQWRVAEAVAQGLSDKEIALRLSISVATVHEHVAALHALLTTRTRAQLVAALVAMPST